MLNSHGGSKAVALKGTSWDAHFLGELQRDDKTLQVGMLDTTDAFRTGFFFEPLSSQPLYFWHQLNRSQQEVLITLESRQGDRLQGRVKILQVPTSEVNCPTLLPSDFEDQQKLLAFYHCLFDAGLRIEIQLQFKDYSVTLLPTRLASESDYAAAKEAIRQISSRLTPSSNEAAEALRALLMRNETVQAFGQCLLGQVTQPGAARMVPLLNCNRTDSCFDCLGGVFGVAGGWLAFGLAALTPSNLLVVGSSIVTLWASTLWGWKTIGQHCPDCVRGCGNGGNDQPPPPRGGGGCSQCSYR